MIFAVSSSTIVTALQDPVSPKGIVCWDLENINFYSILSLNPTIDLSECPNMIFYLLGIKVFGVPDCSLCLNK